jgi:hypothetical protein
MSRRRRATSGPALAGAERRVLAGRLAGAGGGRWSAMRRCVLLVVLALAGCGEVRVVDAVSGAPLRGARVEAGRQVAFTDGDGIASIAGPARIWVTADGHAPMGADVPAAGGVTVALDPDWQRRFLDVQRTRPPPDPADSAHRPDPCWRCPR